MFKTACPYCHAAPGNACRDDANRPVTIAHQQRSNEFFKPTAIRRPLIADHYLTGKCKQLPVIGARWRPGHVVKIDTDAGTFEEVNGPCERDSEAAVQRALLAKPKPQAPRVLDVLFDLMRDAI